MSFIEIKPGSRFETEGNWCTVPGVYPSGLVEVTDPYDFTPQTGPSAGKPGKRIDWLFAIEGGEHDGELIRYRTSDATGPRSSMYGLLTALHNGAPPQVGQKFDKRDLIGRSALLTLSQNGQYLDVSNISALPAQFQQQQYARVTGAPTTGTPVAMPGETLAAATEAESESLPF